MLDITNNPVSYMPPKPTAPATSVVNSSQAQNQQPNVSNSVNSIHNSTQNPIPHQPLKPPTQNSVPPKFEAPKIEPIESNANTMNMFTKMFLAATIIFVVGHIAFFFFYLANSAQIKSQQAKYDNVAAQLNELKPVEKQAEFLIAANQGLNKYYNERVDWKKLWTEINSKLLKRTQITSFSFDEKGTFNLSGQTDSLTNLAKTLVAYKNSVILKNIKMTGSSFGIDEGGQMKVNFSLTGQADLTKVRMDQ